MTIEAEGRRRGQAHIAYSSLEQLDGILAQAQVDAMISFLRELWRYMRVRRKYWLLPIMVAMALLGALIVLSQGSAIAPFIYTLF